MKILVTGGAGYIGSHTCVELIQAGFDLVVIDSLCNSSFESISRVEKLGNQNISFYKVDIRDQSALKEIFAKEKIEAVIHFAGLKAVGKSVSNPIKYFDVNVSGTITLLRVMQAVVTKILARMLQIGMMELGRL
jgi:UDP-glucose 4-epimerase